MSTAAAELSTCAACGKGGDDLKSCAACKLVKYCNVTCQKAHRPKHKKECKKRAAEIFDEALFKMPPPKEDCPICLLRLTFMGSGMQYNSCCGKIICCGCVHADAIARQSTKKICPFCRAPAATDEEDVERIKKRIEAGEAEAVHMLGCRYRHGRGVPKDSNKALELWHQAAKLGCVESDCDIGEVYFYGEGVEKDTQKAKYHWELGAIGGDVIARCNLGAIEGKAGNMNRAMKHFMISA
ncbi:hypothetical protein ACHAXR_002638, partial [Thalassiosira sp. AJA248-18]